VTRPRLHIVRTFNWGLLLLNDRGATDLPEGAPTAPDFATATRSAIAVNVRHAQDVDIDDEPAKVTIDVYLAGAPEGTVDFRADLDAISGTLEIGDADATDELEIGPGTWALALNATPADYPDDIQLWIERRR
jgi:hypothetical protein